ncbi:hypothetical protein BY458DRAFT_525676 [Sporodiniella umbellata]|nr:hypothetical protein BY458DRAFT_525676 [Sporodiniella umbellata]
MNTRSVPCTECRKQRRKCIQVDPDEPCLRCVKLGKVCIDPDSMSIDPNNGIDNLKDQVSELSLTIKKCESEMKALQQTSNAPQQLIEELCYRWNVQIRNGTFSIDTGIKCLSDLLHYQSPFSYLSSGSVHSSSSEDSVEDSRIFIRFKSQEYGSLYGLTGKILSSLLKKRAESAVPLMLEYNPTGSLLIMNQLIDNYFSCHNICTGVVHEGSFRKSYGLVEDPFGDLIGLSICCYVCSIPCRHIEYSARQRRNMADFFYTKTKEILLDQFDNPDKQTDTVTAVVLMYQYIHMTLKFMEYDPYLNMAYQICLDMKAYYSKIGPQPTTEYALYTRHLSHVYAIRVMLDCVTDKGFTKQPIPFPKLMSISDEPDIMAKFLQIVDDVVCVYQHDFVDRLSEQMHIICTGGSCTVQLEVIIKLDEIISECRRGMVSQKNFCKDFYNEEKCMKEIDESEDFFAILTFIHISSIIIILHTVFLRPVALTNGNRDLLNIIRQQSLDRSHKAARLSLYGIKRISELDCLPCYFNLAMTDGMLYTLDTLILQSSENDMASKAGQMFHSLLKIIEKDRGIKPKDLPSFVLKRKQNIQEFISSRKTDPYRYNGYPDPWYALMYDLSQCL